MARLDPKRIRGEMARPEESAKPVVLGQEVARLPVSRRHEVSREIARAVPRAGHRLTGERPGLLDRRVADAYLRHLDR